MMLIKERCLCLFIREKGEKLWELYQNISAVWFFDDRVMKATLSKGVYDSLKTTIDEGTLGAGYRRCQCGGGCDEGLGGRQRSDTFHTLVSASYRNYGGKARQLYFTVSGRRSDYGILRKELIKGEPDASSFPSGGLRATFERGAILRGIRLPMPLSREKLSVFLRHSVLTAGMRWIKRRLCFVRWRRSTDRRCAFSACSAMIPQNVSVLL